MIREHRLVVVDQFSDTADVLRAVFEPRGIEVERRRRPVAVEPGYSSPELLVVDEDSVPSADSTPAQWPAGPRVIIGSARLPQATSQGDHPAAYLSKPFEYPELIRAIEQLLQPTDSERLIRGESAAA